MGFAKASRPQAPAQVAPLAAVRLGAPAQRPHALQPRAGSARARAAPPAPTARARPLAQPPRRPPSGREWPRPRGEQLLQQLLQ